MKYIYYIIGILVVITIALSMRLCGLKVEVSEPGLVVNDRIISRSELDEFAEVGSYHSRGEGFWDAVITRELLIQEALKEGIHKEEAFRKSIESFYEQSLIKALIDRTYQRLSPEVTADMIERYKEMCNKTISYTKFVYESEGAVDKEAPDSVVNEAREFEDLSGGLRFSLFMLEPGKSTSPELSNEGYVVYRLDGVSEGSGTNDMEEDEEIRGTLMEQTREAMFDEWLGKIKKEAHIKRYVDR